PKALTARYIKRPNSPISKIRKVNVKKRRAKTILKKSQNEA
ncbi:4710_t:CDS:1, partial [Entrophospora sp. SA101]